MNDEPQNPSEPGVPSPEVVPVVGVVCNQCKLLFLVYPTEVLMVSCCPFCSAKIPLPGNLGDGMKRLT